MMFLKKTMTFVSMGMLLTLFLPLSSFGIESTNQSGTFEIICNGVNSTLSYSISNGQVTNLSLKDNLNFLISVKNSDNGMITIDIPQELFDSNIDKNNLFTVLINGNEVYTTQEIDSIKNSLTVSLPDGDIVVEVVVIETPENLQKIHKMCSIIQSMVDTKILPPKKQIKNGISSSEIKCNTNLKLIFKISNDSPACVKSTTKIKLIERGWAHKL